MDVRLRINVAPISYLRSNAEIEGFLSADRTTIWVDEYVYSDERRRFRYRFTLAHEIAHWFLHEHLYAVANFRSVEEGLEFLNSIPDEERGWYEFQAYAFAGLVLVPRDPLLNAIQEAKRHGEENGLELDLEQPGHVQFACNFISRRFEVSDQVIMRRGNSDDHWDKWH